MEVDGGYEVGFAAETASRVFDPLNLGVDGLTGSIGDPMLEIGNDVLEAALDHASRLDDGPELAASVQLCHQRKCLRAGRS